MSLPSLPPSAGAGSQPKALASLEGVAFGDGDQRRMALQRSCICTGPGRGELALKTELFFKSRSGSRSGITTLHKV